MATKKGARKPSQKKSASKPASGRPSGKKQSITRNQFEQLPPIIVGGGSTRIWLRTDYRLLANTPNPPGPYPGQAYDCFRFDNNVRHIEIYDGNQNQPTVPIAGQHVIVFREP